MIKLLPPRETYLWLKTLWEHSRGTRISRAQLLANQERKFRKLVHYTYEHSPYYRALMLDRAINPHTCRPEDFPVITKNEVIAHFDQIVTDRRISHDKINDFLAGSHDPLELFEGEFHVLHTSGTSGRIGYFVFSHEAWINGSSHMVRALPLKIRRRVAYVAATAGHFAGASLILTGNHGTNNLFYDVRPYDVGRPMDEIIDALNEFKPTVLSGYAAVLGILAEAQEQGRLRIKPTLVGSGAEPLTPELKAKLKRVFNVPVMNTYASSEHLFMAMTLPGSDGMHLMEDDLIFELMPDHILVTNLFNLAMPLIRYRMEDVLVPDPHDPSGYPFQKVCDLIGRQEDTLLFINRDGHEDFIHPVVIVEFIVPGLQAWQIVLLDRTSFIFRVRFEPGLTDADKAKTQRLIREKMGEILAAKRMENVRFEIEEVEQFALDPVSGKFRMVARPDAPGPDEDRPIEVERELAAKS